MLQRNLEVFLAENRITSEDWQSSNISWDDLLLIGQDHEEQQAALDGSAICNAGLIQRFNGVHSVRWRVKDTNHLMAKIVRKRAAKASKYMNLSVANYMEVIDDLIGLRALHLFKDDCFEIDREIRSVFQLKEKPVAYIRKGDNPTLTTQYEAAGMTVEEHKDNYRSIHYILATKPTRRVVNIELQVRTIFEEGWSEIDHKVRYPNFPNNQHLRGILNVLNGITGQADDTGGLIQNLSQELRLGVGDLLRPEISRSEQDEKGGLLDELIAIELPAKVNDSETSPISVPSIKEKGQSTQSIEPTPSRTTALDVADVTLDEHNAVLRALRDLSEVGAAVKAVNAHSAAMKALSSFNEVGTAAKVMSEHNEAMRTLKGFDDIGAVVKALNEHKVTINALKGFDRMGAVVKAFTEQDTARSLLENNSVSRRLLEDQGTAHRLLEENSTARRLIDDQSAVRRLLEENSVARRVLDHRSAARKWEEDQSALTKAREEQKTVRRFLDEQEAIRNALKR